MRSESTSQPTFLVARVLLASALYALSLLSASAGLSQTVTGTITTKSPAQAPGTWTVTGSMATARTDHAATILQNGQVLVAGGFSGETVYASVELYNPATGVWTAKASMTTPRFGETVTLMPNGQVLAAGGANNSGLTVLASAELYDPVTGLWSDTGSMATPRIGHTATFLTNGQVLVAGGNKGSSDVASAELYDPATGLWTATGSMTIKREQHTATLLPNGQVLVAGGSQSGHITASAELYSPATGLWTATGSMASARYLHTATLLPDGQVLVAGGSPGGYDALASAELYDPTTGLWTGTGRMTTIRQEHTATLLPNGQVLVAGGFGHNLDTPFASAELYDSASGRWTATGSMTTARTDHTATLLPNGQVLVAGGSNGATLASAELYDPVNGMLELFSAASRETHGSAGTFDITLPLTGNPGIEGRDGPSQQTIVFTFNNNVTAADSVITSCGTAGQASVDPNDPHSLLVPLTSQSCDQQFVTVTLNGVHDDQGNTLASAPVTFGLLFGDVNGDGTVDQLDAVSIRAVTGQHVDSSNFRNDLTLDGRINNKDLTTCKTFRGDSL